MTATTDKYRVVHETRYVYSGKVTISHQLAHLKPRVTPWQRVLSHELMIAPEPGSLSEARDYFGNDMVRFELEAPHGELMVRAVSVVEVDGHAPTLPIDAVADADTPADTGEPQLWEEARATPGVWGPEVDIEVEQYRAPSPMAPVLAEARAYAAVSFTPRRPWLAAMLDLTTRIHDEFVYDAKATTVTTKVSEVLVKRRGVCQDFAHTMISCLRALGLPARYVSGYVLNRRGSAALVGADASHAWVASYSPHLGWVAFDPTNGKIADIEFVTLGWGRDFFDVTPLRGVVLGAATQNLAVAVSVQPC